MACFVLPLLSCKQHKEEPVLFTRMNETGINFTNTVTDSKTDNSFLFRNFYNGGGVAIGDINNDSLPDVLLTSNMGENKLYLNKGNFSFEDITPKSGMRQDSMWSTGAVMVDINHDGWLDIYVCNSGHINDNNRRNKLYINNHHNGFADSAAAYGLDHSGFCTQASFFDYDMDGDLDCLIINNSPLPFSSLNYAGMRDTDIEKWNVSDNLKGGGNHLFRNDHDHFVEVTKEAGLHSGLISFGLGVSVGDINSDGYPDIYVGNDFIERDYLYINQKNGTFKDELEMAVQQTSMSSMSSDLADINNDGYPEIFTTDMIPDDDYRLKTTGTFDNIDLYLSKQKAGLFNQYVKNCLQLNNGNNTFSEISNFTKTAGTDWSWGSLMFDADNNGYNDIFICNGINRDLGDLDFLDFFSNDVYMKMKQTGQREEIEEVLKHIPVTPLANRVFKNNGGLQFTDNGKSWGFGDPSFSNSVAYADLDNDGDLDLVVNNENQPAFVYRNNAREQNGNHYISVSLKGRDANLFAVGSKIKIFKGTDIYYRELAPSRGFQASVDYKQVIGLGQQTSVDSMLVIWPDHSFTKISQPAVDTVYYLQQPPAGSPMYTEPMNAGKTLLVPASADLEAHKENDFVDFYYERNLPEALSKEGPHVARGDVNGDGLEDFYMGGGKDQAGQLYIQTAAGFTRKEEPVFKEFADFEDVAVLFFDADKDGDLDLFIGAGGNEYAPGTRQMQHRLYLNDGKGGFTIDTKAFQNSDMNISVAVSDDYDGDGDADLFVGSRSVPRQYGYDPQSYIYNNDGAGHFTDVTEQVAPSLKNTGMVTAAVWADVSGDAQKELVVTGEWMPTRIYSYNKPSKKFELLKATGLDGMSGWWQSIQAADLNGDGKTDLVIGNVGENFYLQPNSENSVTLWLNDFDNSGTGESFLTRKINGRDMPVFLKRDVVDQFPALKKENLKHADYAKKSVQELFGNDMIAKSQQKVFNYSSSIIAYNEGNGKFRVEKLPVMAQLSSVNAIEIADVNNDRQPDLLLGGNLFTFPPQFGRLDGSYGHVLLNGGKGVFSWMQPARSGLSLHGSVKDIKVIRGPGQKRSILFVQNNDKPALFTLQD